MRRLGPTDPLPARPSRVLVAGPPGSGKTTLARAVGRALGVPHTGIDALFDGARWTRRPEFEVDVAALLASDRWVTGCPSGPACHRATGAAGARRPAGRPCSCRCGSR